MLSPPAPVTLTRSARIPWYWPVVVTTLPLRYGVVRDRVVPPGGKGVGDGGHLSARQLRDRLSHVRVFDEGEALRVADGGGAGEDGRARHAGRRLRRPRDERDEDAVRV